MTKRVFAVLRDCTMIEVLMIRACNHRLLILTQRERERERLFFFIWREERVQKSLVYGPEISLYYLAGNKAAFGNSQKKLFRLSQKEKIRNKKEKKKKKKEKRSLFHVANVRQLIISSILKEKKKFVEFLLHLFEVKYFP